MTTLRDLRAKAEAATTAHVPPEALEARLRYIAAASPDVVLALVRSVEELKAAVESARDLAMRVGDGKHELSAKASVVYSHTSAALASVDARFPMEVNDAK